MALAGVQYAAGEHRKARGWYLRALSSYPEDSSALSGAAWCAFHLGERQEARIGFFRVASTNPEYPFVREGLALTTR